jgi:nitrate/TMAO reductase-like tetraheme cytochrome c subunit
MILYRLPFIFVLLCVLCAFVAKLLLCVFTKNFYFVPRKHPIMIYRKNITVILLILSGIVFGAYTMPGQQQAAQQETPEPFKNLKVLPKNISHEALDSVMKSFRTALGVRCNFCHVPTAGNPQKMDYAADTKEEKKVSRAMIKMMMDINKRHFDNKNAITASLSVNCMTCHNGKQKPVSPL